MRLRPQRIRLTVEQTSFPSGVRMKQISFPLGAKVSEVKHRETRKGLIFTFDIILRVERTCSAGGEMCKVKIRPHSRLQPASCGSSEFPREDS